MHPSPSPINRVETALLQIYSRYEISAHDSIVVGVSGGIDSMVLLHILCKLHPAKQIIVCHIDHSLREASRADALFVQETCNRLGVVCESHRVPIAQIASERKMSIEAVGREIRYQFFEQVRALCKGRFIVTAHHKNDSVETMLANLIRGARLRGLSGIRERQGSLLRPLLTLSKEEITLYATANAIEYREDETNADTTLQRNWIRHEILPSMQQVNPKVVDTLGEFAQYAQALDAMMEWILAVHLSGNTIRESDFLALPELLQYTYIEKIYAAATGGTIGLSRGNIEEIARFITEANGGTQKKIGNLGLTKKDRVIHWQTLLPTQEM